MEVAAFSRAVETIRQDAARWVRPEDVADVGEVTFAVFCRLLIHHVPLRAMVWFRLASAAKECGIRGVSSIVQRRLLIKYGLELAPGADVGGGLYIAHPSGCVLHAERIGDNVTVVSKVTFGTRNDARWPVIGDGVFVGSGAAVLGGIEIGASALIGANAVVVDDVPAGHVAVGIPARSRQRSPSA